MREMVNTDQFDLRAFFFSELKGEVDMLTKKVDALINQKKVIWFIINFANCAEDQYKGYLRCFLCYLIIRLEFVVSEKCQSFIHVMENTTS